MAEFLILAGVTCHPQVGRRTNMIRDENQNG